MESSNLATQPFLYATLFMSVLNISLSIDTVGKYLASTMDSLNISAILLSIESNLACVLKYNLHNYLGSFFSKNS